MNLLRSIDKSVSPVEATVVSGTIPSWLNGSLFRNGPGKFEFFGTKVNHLFDGAAVVNKFEIKDGKVEYSNKLIDSEFYKQTEATQSYVGGFGTVAVGSIFNVFGRLRNFFNPPETIDNTNVTIYPFANKHLYAMTELSKINRLSPKDLSLINTTDISKHFEVRTQIAHPHTLADGSWINMGLFIDENRKGHYRFIKYDSKNCSENDAAHLCENGKMIASVPSSHIDGSSYFHSFGISENYIIFLEQPIKMVFKQRLMNAVFNKPTSECFTTDPDFPTRIHIINMHTGEVMPQKFITEAQFSFHHINAYEQKISEDLTNLIVDICSFGSGPEEFNLQNLTFKNLNEGHLHDTGKSKANARRITVPLNKKSQPGEEVSCEIKTLNKTPIEFPTINYGRFNGLPYKYFYGANSLHSKPFNVFKMNVENPEEEFISVNYHDNDNDKNIVPSEPIFVEHPDAKSEDDGVLLVQVLSDECDYLSILDAKDMKEIARANLPKDVKGTWTFHGFFADKATMFVNSS